MSDRINKDLADNHHIILLGYMGCGKSTAGRLLAQQLQLPFVDLDEYLTNNMGFYPKSFENGEIGFRKLEKIALDELLVNQKNLSSHLAVVRLAMLIICNLFHRQHLSHSIFLPL